MFQFARALPYATWTSPHSRLLFGASTLVWSWLQVLPHFYLLAIMIASNFFMISTPISFRPNLQSLTAMSSIKKTRDVRIAVLER